MIVVAEEELVRISDVPRLLPARPNGKRVHVSAVYRWVQRGVRGVRLEVAQVGGTRYTSREAIQRFADQLNGRSDDGALSAGREAATRQRQLDRVDRRLDEMLRSSKGGREDGPRPSGPREPPIGAQPGKAGIE